MSDLNAAGLERLDEFKRRVAYLKDQYRAARAAQISMLSYNDSLRALRSALAGKSDAGGGKRLHPLIEIAISLAAAASRGTGTPTRTPRTDEILAAAHQVVAILKPRRGRPANEHLAHFVRGAMLLMHEILGLEVHGSRTRNSVYSPNLDSKGARIVREIFLDIDPAITSTTLGNMMRALRKSGMVEGQKFRDLFPFYGGSRELGTGLPQPGPGYKLVSFTRTYPIYCS